MKKYSYVLSLLFVFFLPTLYLWAALSIRLPAVQLVAFLVFVTIVGSVYDLWAAKHGRKDTSCTAGKRIERAAQR
jgi:NADH:ubiquinone oxidoreductase subunit 3 (subunit A)